jgi:serine O-acetyltransferase
MSPCGHWQKADHRIAKVWVVMILESTDAKKELANKSVREQKYSLKLLLQQIREDWRAHWCDWTLPGFRALAVHRFGQWAVGVWPGPLRRLVWRIYIFCYRYVRNHYGIELHQTTKVGRRVLIGHQGAIVIHPASEIGDDCILRQNVTLGAAGTENVKHGPILGKRVELACGAVVLGRVVIGDDVRIGPNAVVTTNIPAGSTVMAPPPRVVQFRKRIVPPSSNE